MKKTRFLWIRELPTKCREHEVRGALQRFGEIQKVRMLKDGSTRYAIVAFEDTKSAAQAINSDIKINDVSLKMEYCDSFDTSGINFKNQSDSSCCQPHFGSMDKEQLPQDVSAKGAHDHGSTLGSNDHLIRNVLTSKRSNGRLVTNSIEVSNPQVLRSVQNATNHPRTLGSFRGLKLNNLPPLSKLKDTQLRQGLFTELRHCGRIQSVVLPSTSEETHETGRVAIVTFRRPEEAECAFQAIQSGEKLLFSSSVSAELHPGFESPDDYPVKSSSTVGSSPNDSSSCTKMTSAKTASSAPLTANLNSSASKCPTRTLYIDGLTTGPTGPVTSEQLNTAFRKFGDIIDVKLQTSSNAALIQFAEIRGPIRAMNAHVRDPLRLGGRPLFLAYTPSPPSTSLWFSYLPPVLASMKDEDLLRSLSNLAPVQEVILINRTDSNSRLNQSSQQTPSTSVVSGQGQTPHYVAYIRMLSVEHASRLLTELRSGKHFTERPVPNASIASHSRPSSRRPFAVDFASARQISLVANLQLSAARSAAGSTGIRVISATSLDFAKRLGTNMVPHLGSPTSCSTHSASKALSSSVRSSFKPGSPTPHRSTHQRPPWDSRCHFPPGNNGSATSFPTTGASTTIGNGTDPGGSAAHMEACVSTNSSLNRLDSRPSNRVSISKDSSRRTPHIGSSTNTAVVPAGNFRNTVFASTQSLDRMENMRDSSSSSLSTSSSSSSLTSESSDSSSSSSSSESSSSTSSSSVSSPSSLSGSSTHSRSRRPPPDASTVSNKSHRVRPVNANRSTSHRTRSSPAIQNSSNGKKSQSRDRKPLDSKAAESTPSQPSIKSHSDAMEGSWMNEHNGTGGFSRRPLSIMTTMASAILSPTRSSTASSGGLSSPSAGSGTGPSPGLSTTIVRVSNVSSDSITLVSNSTGANLTTSVSLAGTHHPIPPGTSTGSHAAATAVVSGEFRVGAIGNQNMSSASSGVSSCDRSFSSTSSNSSSGSSPFNHCTLVTLHQTSVNPKLVTSVASNHTHAHKLPPVSTSVGSAMTGSTLISQSKSVDVTARSLASHSSATDKKARVYSTENVSGLKLHISTSGNLVPSQHSSGSVAAFSSPTSTSPLMVSIRLSGSETESHNALPTITSPSALSAHGDVFGGKRSNKGGNVSHPSTPVSAPPHLTNIDTGRRYSSQSVDMSCDKTPLSDSTRTHADWFALGSPVYESMYDKIKRRTNKEAEERRQRQQEALDAREKKRRKQRKKDQLARSPPNSIPFTPPESFGSEHSGKTVGTNSSGKSRCSKSDKAKSDSALRKSSKRSASYMKNKLEAKDFLTNGTAGDYPTSWLSPKSSPMGRTWSSHTSKTRSTELPSKSSHKRSHKAKRSRRDRLSASSSLSSADERNSCSPPGTLTRLSLGMRFPVSATYHECVRPKETSRSNWSPDRDDDSLSRLSSSLSSSSSDGRSDNPLFDRSKPSISPTSTFVPSHCRNYDVHVAKHGHTTPHTIKRDIIGSLHSPITGHGIKSGYRKDRDASPVRSELSNKKKTQLLESSNDRTRTILMDKKTKHISGSKRKHEECLNKQLVKRHRTSHKSITESHERTYPEKLSQSGHRGHTPKPPYFSDDATVLDSETDDIKCSDSVSHTTGTSDQNIRSRIPDVFRNRRLSSGLHSGSDDSSVSGTRSPSPVHSGGRSPLRLTPHYRKHHSINMSVCSDPHSRLVDDRDSMYDAFMDSDRFSTNSKSTPSTEPMEQSELIERNLEMKFSDDEWHSSVASTSPNPTNLEFDEEFCRGDTKTEHSSTTYQSTSFSSQLISPVGKLRTPSEDDSDAESLHKVMTSLTKSSGTAGLNSSNDSHKIQEKPEVVSNTTPQHCKMSSPILMNSKTSSFPSEPSEVKVDVSKEQSQPTADVSSPSQPDRLSPVIKSDQKTLCDPIKEDETKPNSSSHTVPPTAAKVDSFIASEESSMTSSQLRDSSCSVVSHIENASSGSPAHVKQCSSFELLDSTHRSGPSSTSGADSTASSVTGVSLNASLPMESSRDQPPPPPAPLKVETESIKILSSPMRTCSQIAENPVEQSTPNASSTPHPSETQTPRTELKLPKTTVDDTDNSKRVPITTAMQSPTGTNNAHLSVAEPSKIPACTSYPSAGPPIEAQHNMTRYVQSVIERVKAERVEESQQAAAAAAATHCHTNGPHQTSAVTCPTTQFAYSGLTARSIHNGMPPVTAGTGTMSTGGKRSASNNRRPLLVTTSACTSLKPGAVSSSVKWSNSSSSSQFQPSTAPTFCGTGVVSTAACHHSPSVVITSTVTTTSLIPTQTLNSGADLHLLSIPGVNACAPLAVSPQLPPTGRVTRQSQQQSTSALHGSAKRSESTVPIGDIQSVSSKVSGVGSGRRRRRSESKVPAGNTSKDSNPSTAALDSVPSYPVASSTLTASSIELTGKSNSMNEDLPANSMSECVRSGNQTIHNVSSTTSVPKNRVSVDPYEPNFDDESPVGFEHGQLHHHRSTPPVCPSPTPLQTTTVQNVRKLTTVANSVVVPCTSPSSVHSGLSPVSNVGCETTGNSQVSAANSNVPTTNTSSGTVAPSSVSAPPSDSVDEIIRDVCAGQFDVRSYMNSWWTDHPPSVGRQTKCSPRNTPHVLSITTTATTPTTTIATNSTTTCCTLTTTATGTTTTIAPATTLSATVNPSVTSTINVPASVPTPLTASLPNPSPPVAKITTVPIPTVAKSFPLAISEPVVAAVTIPVSSNGAKSITPGKNGSNNVVNITTGNPLLNTLLAALQRIPGSQVTWGGVGSGAISATTITLPVNAARQAAANITAAVLSATSGGAQTPSSEPPVRETTGPRNSVKEKTPVTESSAKVSSAPVTSSACSVESITQHQPTPVSVSSSGSQTLSEPVLNTPSVAAPAPSIAHLPNKPQTNAVTRPSAVTSNAAAHAKRVVVSTASDPMFIDAAGLSAKQVPNQLAQQQQQHLSSQSMKTALLDRSVTGVIPPSRTVPPHQPPGQSGVLHLPISVPMSIIPPVSLSAQPSILPTGSGVTPSSTAHHPSVVDLVKPPPFTSPVVNQSQPTPLRHPNRIPPVAPPVVPGRSPPLSVPPLTIDAIQVLLERFGAFEPSALRVIAQAAAAAGVGPVENSVGSSDGENPPALAYLRRCVQQLLESRACNGPTTGGKHPTVPNPMDGPVKAAPPHVTTPPVSLAVPVLSFANQPRASQLSALAVNTISSDTSVTITAAPPLRTAVTTSAPHDTNAALISPPVGVARHSPTNIPTMTTGGSGNSAHMSWNAIGQAYPLVWQGRLSLKNAETRVALHYIHGNPTLLHDCMQLLASGGGGQSQHSLVSNGGPLRIVQRMRLEPAQLEGVQRKIHQEGASCACLALPAGNSTAELIQQTQILNESFIRYMQEKMAAGIINVGFPECQQGLYVVHIFPPCEFSHTQLNLAAPELYRRVLQANQSHLLVVITTV